MFTSQYKRQPWSLEPSASSRTSFLKIHCWFIYAHIWHITLQLCVGWLWVTAIMTASLLNCVGKGCPSCLCLLLIFPSEHVNLPKRGLLMFTYDDFLVRFYTSKQHSQCNHGSEWTVARGVLHLLQWPVNCRAYTWRIAVYTHINLLWANKSPRFTCTYTCFWRARGSQSARREPTVAQ